MSVQKPSIGYTLRGYGHLEFSKNRFFLLHFLKVFQNFIEIGAYLTEIHEFNRIEFKQIEQIKQIAVHEVSIAEEGSLYGPEIDDSM